MPTELDQQGAGDQQQQQQQTQSANNQQVTPPANFDEWLKSQDKEVKGLYDAHIQGLKGALQSERKTHDDLEKQVRDLAKKAEAGSDAQKQFTENADKLAKTERQNEFYDQAHAAGVRNLRLAYLAAQDADLFDKHGEVDFDKLKKSFPELFVTGVSNTVKTHAGDGTSNPPGGKRTMDDIIRRRVGINT